MMPKVGQQPSTLAQGDLHAGSNEHLSQSEIKGESINKEPNPLILALLGKSYDLRNEAPGVSTGLPAIDDEVRQRIAAEELSHVPTSVEVIACLSHTGLLNYSSDVRESAFSSLANHDKSLAAAVTFAATFSTDSEFRERALSSLFEIDPCLAAQRAEVLKSSDPNSSVKRFAEELLIDYSDVQLQQANPVSKDSESTGKLIAEILYNKSAKEIERIECLEQLVKTQSVVAAVVLSSIQADPESLIGRKVPGLLKQNFPELFRILSN